MKGSAINPGDISREGWVLEGGHREAGGLVFLLTLLKQSPAILSRNGAMCSKLIKSPRGQKVVCMMAGKGLE